MPTKVTNEVSSVQVMSPLTGSFVQISEVPDPTFSEKMMGDGVAIRPDNGQIQIIALSMAKIYPLMAV